MPLAVYVHLPWCIRKCPYCDFNSHALNDELEEDNYIDAVLRDLEYEYARHPAQKVYSVFFGGGTPSLFQGRSFARVLSSIDGLWGLQPDAEITVEANPGAAEAARFESFRAAGINRLSIGVQSFDDAALLRLGRVHDSLSAFEAVLAARQSGFDRINLDIMFALPDQDLEHCLTDIRSAIACGVSHLSCYQLTIEPNTAFHHDPPTLPDDDSSWRMQQALQTELAAANFEQYEVSAYAMLGERCKHNQNYWLFGDYIGVGAGAHGKTTQGEKILRRRKQRHPRRFMDAAGGSECLTGENELSTDERVFEFMLNALRLNDGFERETMLARTGLGYSAFEKPLNEAVDRGLIEIQQQRIFASSLGQRFLNDLTALFLP